MKKMRKFVQNKMWRDKAITMLEAHGSHMHYQVLDDAAYDHQLRLKLLEEADEVRLACSQKELMAELADVLEVIESICDAHKISLNDIKILQEKKREERGGFKSRKYITIAEHPEGSMGEKYCLAAPEKYPEVF